MAAGVVLWKGQDFAPIFEAICGAAAESPVQVRWILDAVRQFGTEHVMQVAELAAERVDEGVIAFGIGGSEERGPANRFGEAFAFARAAGLRLTAHAGESMGPQSIWDALELGAERIGHGIAAVRDEALMRHLRERDIPLEICISSNLVTGVVTKIEDHPVRQTLRCGRADRAELGRSRDVPVLVDGRISIGGGAFRVHGKGAGRAGGEWVPVCIR